MTRVNNVKSFTANILLSTKAGDWSETGFFSLQKTNMTQRGSRSFFHVPSAASWFDVSAPPPPRDTKDRGAPGALHFHPTRCSSAQLQSHHHGDGTNEREEEKKKQGSTVSFADVWNGQASLGFYNTFSFYASRSKRRERERARRKLMTFFVSVWLVWSLLWVSAVHRYVDVLQIKGMTLYFCISVGRN